MISFALVDAATKIVARFFNTAFGMMVCTTTYQKHYGLWQEVSWVAAVSETALVSSDGDGSIEISDILITAEKKAGGSITIRFADGVVGAFVNTKDVVNTTVADGVVNVASNFGGKVQGWQAATLYYTIVGTYKGSILITFVKHNKKNSMTYNEMSKSSGW